MRAKFLLGDEPSQDLGRKKVGGNAKIGLYTLQEADHRLDIQAIQSEAATRMIPRLIGAIVQDADEPRSAADHGEVSLVVQAPKQFASVTHGVEMLDHALAAGGVRALVGLRGTMVPSARRG